MCFLKHNSTIGHYFWQVRRNRGDAGGAKTDLLPIDNDSEKKKSYYCKKKRKKVTNITTAHFMWAINLMLTDIVSFTFFIFYHDDYHFEKQSFIKSSFFHLGYKPQRYTPLGSKPCLFHWDYV